AAASNLAPSASPARISPLTAMGRMRTSPAAPLPVCLGTLDPMLSPIPAAEVPASHQLLRPPFSAGDGEFAEIVRAIDIPRNPRQFEHNPRQARCLCRRQVWQEAVVSEAQRK